ncbi:MAG: PIN domain-containing protein [Nitrospirae bacterium]|nr:PIN domain-containing protein [Nitrospirota bacterium]
MMAFIDTGAWIAVADRNGQYSQEAGRLYRGLILERQQLVTSDFVLVETYNLLLKTIGNKATISFENKLKMIPFLKVAPITMHDWERAWKILEKYSDKDFSFTDCTSFALMERLKIRNAFSFDSHFSQFGFLLIN